MGKASEIFFIIALITLFSPILCRSSHHNPHNDKNWISYLPGSSLDESTDYQEITGKLHEIQERNSISDSSESSTPTVLMSDTYRNNNQGSQGVVVGVPVGGIIVFILICYCCYRCCCRKKVVNQGTTIITRAPEPANNPTPIIINTVTHAAPPPAQTQSPIVIQNVTNAPPQQQQQPYQPAYEMRPPPNPMGQWNQGNQYSPPPPQQQQYYPDGGYPNPNAPPQYGKY